MNKILDQETIKKIIKSLENEGIVSLRDVRMLGHASDNVEIAKRLAMTNLFLYNGFRDYNYIFYLILDDWFAFESDSNEYRALVITFESQERLLDDSLLCENPFLSKIWQEWENNSFKFGLEINNMYHAVDPFLKNYLVPTKEWKAWRDRMHLEKGPFRKWKTGKELPYYGGWRLGKEIEEILEMMHIENNSSNRDEYNKMFQEVDDYYKKMNI